MRRPVREAPGRHLGQPALRTSRERQRESPRRPERALRPVFGWRPESVMRRGGPDRVACKLRVRPAASQGRRRQQGSRKSHAHREGDEVPSHPAVTLYDGVYSPPVALNRPGCEGFHW